MEQMEHGGVERRASSLLVGGAIEFVADDGSANVGEVNPDLVGAAGEQPQPERGVLGKPLQYRELGYRLAPGDTDPHAPGPLGVPAERRLDPAVFLSEASFDQGPVLASHGPGPKLAGQVPVGLLRPGQYQQPAGAPIEAVNDPGTLPSAG
jgi:hypothetical protein